MQALGQVQRDSGKSSEGSGEGLAGFGAERSNSIGFRNSREGSEGFGAEPNQVQYGVESDSTGFWKKFR